MLIILAIVALLVSVAFVGWTILRPGATGRGSSQSVTTGPFRYDRTTGALTGFAGQRHQLGYAVADGGASISGTYLPANPVVVGFYPPPTCGVVVWVVKDGSDVVGGGRDDLGSCPTTDGSAA